MPFTDRFIKVPVIKYDLDEENLMGKDPHDCGRYLTYKCIDPQEIASYDPAIPKGQSLIKENEVWTSVYMKYGDSFYTPITIEEFESILNNFKHIELWATNQ